jgi:hypothetical protein
MYPMNQASVALLRFARARCLRHLADPLCRPLAGFLTARVREERRHDRWVAADLAALGVPAAPPDPPTALTELVGAQYYLIDKVHPVTVLGYVALLQSDPPSRELLEHARVLSCGSGAVTALAQHAERGQARVEATYALLDKLALSSRQRAAVGLSTLHAAAGVMALFADLASEAPAARQPPVLATDGALELSDAECALFTAMNSAAAGIADAPDVVAHSGDVVGGLFL